MAEDKIGKCGETAMAKPILFQCAEDALATALEQAYAGVYHLNDQMRGPCPLCDESDQRCTCWEDDS